MGLARRTSTPLCDLYFPHKCDGPVRGTTPEPETRVIRTNRLLVTAA
ncbi:hypothetical protein HMPREF9057_02845 [Actinomyces sp. oral taxon 171 str. F0337]|nr:hypothetical protein HMPREF9057_02845 [Actinomyces sp. oral taxon 171 str. F0337]